MFSVVLPNTVDASSLSRSEDFLTREWSMMTNPLALTKATSSSHNLKKRIKDDLPRKLQFLL